MLKTHWRAHRAVIIVLGIHENDAHEMVDMNPVNATIIGEKRPPRRFLGVIPEIVYISARNGARLIGVPAL